MSRSIIKKTAGIGGSTLLSRFFAYIREMLLIQFLGIGYISDAFFIALRVPNSLRKIFAEGALSSVLVPALIRAEKDNGRQAVNRLLTLAFVGIQAFILCLVIIMVVYAQAIITCMAPGASGLQLSASVQFLKILAPFILFLSSSAILASALQASHHFFLPGLAPALLNCFYVVFIALCLYLSWSVTTFCWLMIAASIVNLIIHMLVSFSYNFRLSMPDRSSFCDFKKVIFQLFPSLLSVGINEVNFWIDSGFASYLSSGTLSLLRYAYQFVNIPLGVLVTSLSIVLLPYFSKIGHSKEELSHYLVEAIKFVVWMMLPITLIMMYCSREIFETMFFSDKFTMDHVLCAQYNMNAYLVGLTFFGLEKIMLNAFYALQSAGIATGVSIITIGMNYWMNGLLMKVYGGMGLALATSISTALRIVLFGLILSWYFKIKFQALQLFKLFINYCFQLFVLSCFFTWLAYSASSLIRLADFSYTLSLFGFYFIFDANFFLHSFGYWVWFCPLAGGFLWSIYRTRKFFGVSSLSYLE